jgi:hypothetical protein
MQMGEKSGRRSILKIAGLSVVATVMVAVAAGVWRGEGTLRSDDDVRRRFFRDEKEFETLRMMMDEERNVHVIGDDNVASYWEHGWGWFEQGDASQKRYGRDEMLHRVGLDAGRYDQYLRLLKRVGGYRVSREPDGLVVHLRREGTLVNGFALDVVYTEVAPTPVVPDTFAPEHRRPNTTVYAPIKGGWYIRADRG